MHSGHLIIKNHILLTGATGYIGGSVLSRLLNHTLSDTFRITALVRAPEKATQFRKMGLDAVVGSYADHDLLTQLSANADIVIACADADDLGAAKAILRGLKERHDKTGRIPSLIHTSGTGVLIDDAKGMHPSDTIYSDLDLSALEGIPRDQPHRKVDLTIIDADKQGYVKTYIVLPSTIYGRATGSLVDAGLQNPRSQQIPKMCDVALARGRAGVLGKGANIWSNVHIAELASLYILLVDHMIPHEGLDSHSHGTDSDSGSRPAPRSRPPSRPRTPVVGDPSYFGHGPSGYYFAENGEHDWLSVSEAIGRAMVDLGRATEPTPTQFSDEEKERFFNNVTKYLDSNSRCKADRPKRLGWRPKKTTKDLLASVKLEVKGGNIA